MVGEHDVVIIGGGVGALAAAIDLARSGASVALLERAAEVGGKVRTTAVDGRAIDAGPTVLTMRWVFDELFADAGTRLEDHVTLHRADVLGRHAWPGRGPETLDLFAERSRTRDAIGRFAGAVEARGFDAFAAYAERIFHTVEEPFLRAQKPTFGSTAKLARAIGVGAFLRLDGLRTMRRSLGEFFRDERLIQLFGRYATYSGSSPFEAPATLNVISHVEERGVWFVEGGMIQLARAMGALAERLGVTVRTQADVASVAVEGGRATGVVLRSGEHVGGRAVVFNGDVGALSAGRLGEGLRGTAPAPKRAERSLSALTIAMVAEVQGFDLVRHNVFFSSDYEREFRELREERRLPSEPTVYVCAQDRSDGGAAPKDRERVFALVNAPADGDVGGPGHSEVEACTKRTLSWLERGGLRFTAASELVVTSPAGFERAFPGTGGALYGAATHGMTSTFTRAGARARLPGLYLTGGSVHPGAGVPMAATSGRLAATCVLEDLASTSRWRATGTSGGTWT